MPVAASLELRKQEALPLLAALSMHNRGMQQIKSVSAIEQLVNQRGEIFPRPTFPLSLSFSSSIALFSCSANDKMHRASLASLLRSSRCLFISLNH